MLNLSKNRQEKKSVHFYIIDNDASFANKLSRSLSNDPDYKIDTFYNKDEFMESYNSVVLRKRKEKINIVIIDSNQLDQPNDLELIHTIKQNLKNTEIIILTEEEKTTILNDIITPKSMLTVDTELVDPEFLFITLEVFFKFDPSLTNLTKTQLENKVVDAIERFDEEQLRKFDRVLRYSQLLSVIDNADPAVLNSFARVLVQKRFIPRLNVAQTYELEFSVDLFKSFGTRPVIFLSTEFTTKGFTDCRFTDVLNNDGTRRVQIVRGSKESPQVVVDNAGTIEGSKITLVNFQPERFEGSTIVLECIPNSFNVFGKRNTILTIDCGCPQFKIEGSVDTFATGAEYAGDTYEVAPKNADL